MKIIKSIGILPLMFVTMTSLVMLTDKINIIV